MGAKKHNNEKCNVPFCGDCLTNIKAVAQEGRKLLGEALNPTPDNTVNDLDEELRDLLCFIVVDGGADDEGLVEYTDGGVWVTDKALKKVKALYINRLEAMMEKKERCMTVGYIPGKLGNFEAIPISILEQEIKRFKV